MHSNIDIFREWQKVLFFAILMVLISNCSPKQSLPDPLEAGWENQPVCEVLQETSKVRILKCTFPPGVGHEKHFHAPHFGYIITGSRFKITDDSGVKEVDVKSGSTFSKEVISTHEVLNIGDTTAVFLIIESK